MDVQYNNNNNSNVRNNSLQNAMVTRTRRRRCDELDVIPMDRALLCMMLPRVMRLFPKNVNPKWILNVMHGLILWWSNCETPAMRAMNLQVVNQSSIDPSDDGSLNNTNNSSKKDYKRLFWMILSILDFTSSGSSLLPASLPFVSSNNNIVARQRQEWMYQSVRKWISCFLPPLKLYIFLKCLSSQQHNSSASLAMTLGGLQYIPTTNTTATNTNESQQQQQPINFVYAHRRYMYEELMELAYAMLPISRMGILPSALVALIKRIKTRYLHFLLIIIV